MSLCQGILRGACHRRARLWHPPDMMGGWRTDFSPLRRSRRGSTARTSSRCSTRSRPAPATVEHSPFGEMAQMLLDKGLEHERAVLDRYRAEGLSVFEVPERVERRVVPAVGRPGRRRAGRGARRGVPDAVRARGHPGHRRLPASGRRRRDGHVHLRADRRQARPQRGQARPRPAVVLLRRGDRGGHRRAARAGAHRAGVGRQRDDPGRRRAAVLASPAGPAGEAPGRRRRGRPPGPSRATTASSASSSWCARPSGVPPIRSSTWPVSAPPIA